MMVSYFWVTRLRWTMRASSFGEKTTRSPLTPGELAKKPKRMGTVVLVRLYLFEFQEIRCSRHERVIKTSKATRSVEIHSQSGSLPVYPPASLCFSHLSAIVTDPQKIFSLPCNFIIIGCKYRHYIDIRCCLDRLKPLCKGTFFSLGFPLNASLSWKPCTFPLIDSI